MKKFIVFGIICLSLLPFLCSFAESFAAGAASVEITGNLKGTISEADSENQATEPQLPEKKTDVTSATELPATGLQLIDFLPWLGILILLILACVKSAKLTRHSSSPH